MDSFYANLLSGGIDGAAWDEMQNDSPVEEQQLPSQQDAPPNKIVNKRSKNFNDKEDEMLVSAWLNISMDASQGNEQSRTTYWKRIHGFFHEHKDFVSERSQQSLLHRWSAIQEHVNKFCGCFDRISRRRQSGTTQQDKIVQACALYKEEEGKAFQYLHCWNVLQHHPKWSDRLSQKKQKLSSNATPGTSSPVCSSATPIHVDVDAPATQSDPFTRPIGKKAAKEGNRRSKSSASSTADSHYMEALDNIWEKKRDMEVQKEMRKEERYKEAYALEQEKIALEQVKVANDSRRIALEEERVRVDQEKLDLKRRTDDERIMTMDITGMPRAQQEYYFDLQKEIMARRSGR